MNQNTAFQTVVPAKEGHKEDRVKNYACECLPGCLAAWSCLCVLCLCVFLFVLGGCCCVCGLLLPFVWLSFLVVLPLSSFPLIDSLASPRPGPAMDKQLALGWRCIAWYVSSSSLAKNALSCTVLVRLLCKVIHSAPDPHSDTLKAIVSTE